MRDMGTRVGDVVVRLGEAAVAGALRNALMAIDLATGRASARERDDARREARATSMLSRVHVTTVMFFAATLVGN